MKDWKEFSSLVNQGFTYAGIKLKKALKESIFNALSEKDETAEIVYDDKGNKMHDSELRDHEYIPYDEDIDEFFVREVLPFVSDAWIDETYTDHKDGKIGRMGYEINFNRYFYVYQPPRSLEEIETDIKKVEAEIMNMLSVTLGR